MNDIAVNQLYGIYQNGEMSLFASFLTLFFDLTDGSKILANVKGEQLAKLKRYLVLKNTKYVSEEKDFLEWIFNENAVFDETYKKENGWIVTDVERKVGDQLQYKAILFIHAQTGECIAEMVAVKKEDGSLDTSSVSMEKFTVDGMVAESIIKKVNIFWHLRGFILIVIVYSFLAIVDYSSVFYFILAISISILLIISFE